MRVAPQVGTQAWSPGFNSSSMSPRPTGLPPKRRSGCGILAHAHFANRDAEHAAELLERDVMWKIEPDGAAVAMAEVAGCLAILERDIPRARLLSEEPAALAASRRVLRSTSAPLRASSCPWRAPSRPLRRPSSVH